MNTNEEKSAPLAATNDAPMMTPTQTTQSASIGKLAFALAKAQGEMQAAKKDSANPFFKSKYADLNEVWSTIRKPLAANQLAVIQATRIDGNDVRLETTLAHSSGEWICSAYPVAPQKRDPQGYGSALTYARRYALSALVGVVSEIDDDGESAMIRTAPRPEKTPEREKAAQKFFAVKNDIKPTLEIPKGKKGKVEKHLAKLGWIKKSIDELTAAQIERCNAGMDKLVAKAEASNG